MIKKVLLMIAVMIFAFSCSKTPTEPNGSGTGDTGNGSIIEEGTGTSNPASISEFLKKHSGVYSAKEDGMERVYYRIENGVMYNGLTENIVDAQKTLLNNKLELYYTGNPSGTGYEKNDEMATLNFLNDGNIDQRYNGVFVKEQYKKVYDIKWGNPIDGLKQYSGNYFQYDDDYPEGKYYNLSIDENGQIYNEIDAQNVNISLNNNVLVIEAQVAGPESGTIKFKYEYYLQDDKAILSRQWMDDKEIKFTLKRYDLFTPYNGTYTSSEQNITLTVTSANAVISSTTYKNDCVSLLSGNTLNIYDYYQSGDTWKNELHKIVFNEDGTATYTKPDGGNVILNRN